MYIYTETSRYGDATYYYEMDDGEPVNLRVWIRGQEATNLLDNLLENNHVGDSLMKCLIVNAAVEENKYERGLFEDLGEALALDQKELADDKTCSEVEDEYFANFYGINKEIR